MSSLADRIKIPSWVRLIGATALIRKITLGLFVLLILLFAFWVRSNTFWLPHWQGDQSQYVTLAMKIDAKGGLDDYNLRNVQLRTMTFKDESGWVLTYPRMADEEGPGDLIKIYRGYGLSFYDMPLFYKGPLFPKLLAFSHRWLTRNKQPFVVVRSNLGPEVYHNKPAFFIRAQFWAAIIPLASSLIVILLTFILAQKMFGNRAALYASILMAVQPVDILCSNRLWTESLLTLMVMLSFLIFFIAFHNKDMMGIVLSGVFGGFAILAKQNAVVMLGTIWIYTVLCHSRCLIDVRSWPRIVLNRSFLIYFAVCLIITWGWFSRVYQTYGTPVYEPTVEALETFDPGGWHTVVLTSRPHPILFFILGIPYLSPFFGLIIFSIRKFFMQFKASIVDRAENTQVLYLWLWIIPFCIFFMFFRVHSKEHRYLLPIYPALAILAAHMIDYLRLILQKILRKPLVVDAVIFGLIGWSASWSIPKALGAIINEQNLILEPF